ncbi:MAG: hypothetical protein IKG58_01320 [Bacilli bacterium]|nr:hypothetical protein [Bacilli bacterium]MBR3049184.1 hypothetical protein [Bacilli bacterium]
MRKYGIIALVVVLSFVMVGCGNGKDKAKKKSNETTLVCTQTQSGVDIEFNVGFKGKSVRKIDFNYDMDISSYTDEQIKMFENQDFCKLVKDTMSDYKSAFKDCKQSVKNKHLKLYAVLDVHKLDGDISKKMTTPKKAKEELEKTGYKCKINK